MDDEPAAPGTPVLRAFPIGVYRHHSDLEADREADRLAKLLEPYGVRPHPWSTPAAQRDDTAVKARLRAWWEEQEPGEAILYWVGHGTASRNDAALAHATSPKDVHNDGVDPKAIAQALIERQGAAEAGWALVIIDACWSSTFVDGIYRYLIENRETTDRFGLLGVMDEGPIFLGRFTDLLESCLHQDFGRVNSVLLRQLLPTLEARLPHGRVLARGLKQAALVREKPVSPFTGPLDVLEELRSATRDQLPPTIWEQLKADLPSVHNSEMPWLFEGRDVERARICRWLEQSAHGMMIVTGDAGSGKSALLGQILLHSLPSVSGPLSAAGLTSAPSADHVPPARVFDGVVNLAEGPTEVIAARIARAAGLADPDSSATLGPAGATGASRLLTQLEQRERPLTLLLDGFDESPEPETLASALLRPLAALPQVRVLIGTRPSSTSDFDAREGVSDLLAMLGQRTANDTGEQIWLSPENEAVRSYVMKRLVAACADGTVVPRDEVDTALQIERIARAVALERRGFLFARLAVNEIIADQSLFDPEHADTLDEALRGGHRGLFARAVRRLAAQSDSYYAIMDALSLAQGAGIPLLDGVWRTMGAARAGGGRTVSQAEVSAFLDAARPYVTMDIADGQTVFRFAHRTFADYFTRGLET